MAYGKAIFSQYYGYKDFQMPETIFCYDYNNNKSIDQNFMKTGSYFENVTKNSRIDNFFENIGFKHEKTNNFVLLDLNSIKKYQLNALKLITFYYLFKKFFSIRLEQTYKEKKF
jgi:hypothetical protein